MYKRKYLVGFDYHSITYVWFLTDDIFLTILRSDLPELHEAQEILRKIERRDLYKYLGETQPPEGKEIKKVDMVIEIALARYLNFTLFFSCDHGVMHLLNKYENQIAYIFQTQNY